MALMFHSLIHTRNADDCLIMLAIKIQQVLMVPTNWLIPEEGQQILDVLLGPINVFQREDIEVIEVQLIVNLLKRLQYEKRVFSLILDRIIIFGCVLFLGAFLDGLLFDYLGSGVDVGGVFYWGFRPVAAARLALEQH